MFRIRTSDEIIKLKSPPDELLEMHLYQVLEIIRWQYYNNQIDKSKAIMLKNKAIKKYDGQVKEYEFMLSMFNENLEKRKKASMDIMKFNKNPNIELAKKIIEEMI